MLRLYDPDCNDAGGRPANRYVAAECLEEGFSFQVVDRRTGDVIAMFLDGGAKANPVIANRKSRRLAETLARVLNLKEVQA